MNHGRKDHKDIEAKMEKTLSSLKTDLKKVRTGRASLALFDDIRVDYYGTPTPLSQMATLAVPEARLSPFSLGIRASSGKSKRPFLNRNWG